MPVVLTPRPARAPAELPEPGVVRIAPPPAVPVTHEGMATAVLAGAGSLGTLAVLGMGRRSSFPLLLGLGLATLGATVGARLLVLRRARRQRQRVAARWRARLDTAVDDVRAAASRQRVALLRAHPVGGEALQATARGASGLWERRPADPDVWRVAAGTGRRPARVRLAADPVDASTEVDATLERAAQRAAAAHAHLAGAPITVDLAAGPCAVIGARDTARALARHMVAELAVTRPPDEMRVAVLTDEPAAWAWLRWLPHAHAAADGAAAAICTTRAELDPSLTRGGDVLLVVDVGGVEHAPLPDLDLNASRVRSLALVRDDRALAGRCAATVVLDAGTGMVRDAGGAATVQVVAGLTRDEADEVARLLCPRRLAGRADGADASVRLSRLLGVDPRAHDARAHWLRGPAGLAMPIGRGPDGGRVVLDLAEPAAGGHGPHGLLIGATGSGKSELLRALVTGLAVTAAPTDVALLLVDWKGGAAFDGLAGLPHVAGLVTNLAGDPALVDRVGASLRGELERRQQILRDAQAGSVRALRERDGMAPPALVVVVDEFGELLSAHPDVLDVVLQVGRLGRSLGVHLVLASQRLDEGRLHGLEAHLRWRICLRTFTAAESVAVIGSPDAAALPSTPGEGWLVVDGQRTRLRAAHASAPVVPPVAPPPVRTLALSPEPVSSGIDGSGGPCRTGGDELAALVAAIERSGVAAAAPVWLPPLGCDLSGIDAVALADEPRAQRQVPWSPEGHTAVVGAPGSGISTALAAVAAERCRDPRVRVVALRFGGAGLLVDPHRLLGEAGPNDDPAYVGLLLDAAVLAARDEGPWAGVRLMLVVDDLARVRDVVDDLDHRLARAAAGVLLAVGAHRWSDLRAGLRDVMTDRIELRLADAADSDHGRGRAQLLTGAPAGRCLLTDGRLAQVVRPVVRTQAAAEDPLKLRPLPSRVVAPRRSAGIGIRLGDHREVPAPADHLLVLGDRRSGRSSLLGRLVQLAVAAQEPVVLVDPRRRHRVPRGVPVLHTGLELADNLARTPSGLVVVDDADLVPSSQLSLLADLVTGRGGRGLRVVVARPVVGATRAAYEPAMMALREALAATLLLPGDASEGPVAGGLRAGPGPPGRGVLVAPGEPPVPLQLYAPVDDVVVALRGVA